MTDAPPRSVEPRPRRVDPVAVADIAAWLQVPEPRSAALVTGVSLNSGRVRPGDLYAALPGGRAHGADYARRAAGAGATAVLTDPDGATRAAATGLPVLVAERPRQVLGEVSAMVYGRPAQRLTTVGVTGTSGKTTTTHLAETAIRVSGRTAAVVGTNGSRVAGVPVASSLTTPEAPELHALLAVMVEHGVDVAALEVSSHALVQGRVDGVRFDVAVFLNLGHDHLDFHADMAGYFAAKASLFVPDRARRAVIDIDDAHGRRLAESVDIPVVTISSRGADADWRAVDVQASATGSVFVVVSPDGVHRPAAIDVPGRFNVANALAAIAALVEAGLPAAAAVRGVGAATGVPGRMQRVDVGQDFAAVVDYAHKPEALEAVLWALRAVTTGRLIVVLGAGGDRDRDKRPAMGRIATDLADVVVITDDNPRSEDPGSIRAEILAGTVSGSALVREVADRAAAIETAVDSARAGDCVLVAGKGHETGQETGGAVVPFDDRDALTRALQRRGTGR